VIRAPTIPPKIAFANHAMATTPEELGQEDTAQDDEANLAREKYFRDILLSVRASRP